jgi:hypothetical protein
MHSWVSLKRPKLQMSYHRQVLSVIGVLFLIAMPHALAQSADELWLGAAPFCRAKAADCTSAGMTFIRAHASGNSETCLTGEKVLCRGAGVSVAINPAASLSSCPNNAKQAPATLTCVCSASQAASGTVWGSGVYTDDSSICRAARHAGIIPASGGAVRVDILPGQSAYTGSQANGVTTTPYGSWARSFKVSR